MGVVRSGLQAPTLYKMHGQPSKSHVLEGVKGLKAFTVNGKYSRISTANG